PLLVQRRALYSLSSLAKPRPNRDPRLSRVRSPQTKLLIRFVLVSSVLLLVATVVVLLAAQRQTEHSSLQKREQLAHTPLAEFEMALLHRSTSSNHEDSATP